MNPSPSAQQANLDLVAQVGALIGTGFADPDEDLFAPDFVFHFNPHLPELDGDHHGLDGVRSPFERLQQTSDTGYHNEPHWTRGEWSCRVGPAVSPDGGARMSFSP